jgi:hypothetical protein
VPTVARNVHVNVPEALAARVNVEVSGLLFSAALAPFVEVTVTADGVIVLMVSSLRSSSVTVIISPVDTSERLDFNTENKPLGFFPSSYTRAPPCPTLPVKLTSSAFYSFNLHVSRVSFILVNLDVQNTKIMSIILFRLVPEYLNHSASNSLIFLSLAASMQACEENHFRFKLLFQNSDFFEEKQIFWENLETKKH